MGWDTSKVMGVWVVFHTIALGLIEVLRYWSQVGAWSFWSLELSVQGPGGPHLWLKLPGRSARGGRVVGCGFGPCLDIDTLLVFKVTIFVPRSSPLWPGVHGVAGHGTLS